MATAPPSADMVGKSFINQFYNVLHATPGVVHRFYTDESKLSRDFGSGVETVETQEHIHKKIVDMGWSDFNAEIKTVDSQNSLSGGVLVMVTGVLSSRSAGEGRNFVQTFFLAPQEKGYFVLNDVFRYVDEAAIKPQTYGLANGVAESVPETEEQLTEEPEDDPEEEQYVVTEEPLVEPEDELLAEPQVIEEPVVEAVPEEAPAPPAEELHGEPAKKSYASIVSLLGKGGGGFQPKPAPVKPAPQPAAAAPVAAPADAAAAEEAPIDAEGDKRSVYVKFLPVNVTEQQLEVEFKKFGSLKPGGIQIRTLKQQNGCYAFIEFEDQQSAANAIQASGFQMNGRDVQVEVKKPANRRFQSDRSGGFQSDRSQSGGRGRGYYSGGGGRGFGDREGGRAFNDQRDGSGSGRGFTRRNESSEEGGFRRYDNQRAQRRAPSAGGGGGGGGGNGSNRNGRTAE